MTPSLLGRTDLVTTAEIEGKTELTVSAKGIAYLTNLTEEEVDAEFRRQMGGAKQGTMRMPRDWYRAAQENMARLQSDDWVEILELMVLEREGTN